MENNNIFAKGLYFNLPNTGAPEWIKGKLSFNVPEFIQFLNENAKDGKIKLDLKVGKSGKGYAQLDNWQPNGQQQQSNGIPTPTPEMNIPADLIVKDSDVPF